MKCGTCNREWPDKKCHVLDLTPEDKAYAKIQGVENPPDQYIYCNPCWKVLSDRLMGAQFIKGSLQVQLQAKGVGNAEALSQQYFNNLLSLTSKKKS